VCVCVCVFVCRYVYIYREREHQALMTKILGLPEAGLVVREG